MATPDINAICSQILTSDDLIVEEELFQQVLKDKIVTKLLDNKGSKYIKIFSKEQLFLSHITPLLHNIGFEIIDEVTYNVMSQSNVKNRPNKKQKKLIALAYALFTNDISIIRHWRRIGEKCNETDFLLLFGNKGIEIYKEIKKKKWIQ